MRRWEILADRGDEIKNFIDVMWDFAQDLAAEFASRSNLSADDQAALETELYNGIVGNSFQYLRNIPEAIVGFYDRESEVIVLEEVEYRRPATAVSRRSWGEIKKEML